MMKVNACAILVAMLLPSLGWAQAEQGCPQADADLKSLDYDVFGRGLQSVIDHNCVNLLPRVAELFLNGDPRASFSAANTLALSGRREYGPILIRAYFEASRSQSKFPNRPLALTDAVLLACSDLPRGREIRNLHKYVKTAPPLDDACIEEFRRLMAGHYDEDPVCYFAMELLQETSSTNALDIIASCLSSHVENSRDEAVIALQHMPIDSTLDLFTQALKDRDDNVRYQAVRLLRDVRDPRVVDLFRERIPSETDPQLLRMMRARLSKEPRGESQ